MDKRSRLRRCSSAPNHFAEALRFSGFVWFTAEALRAQRKINESATSANSRLQMLMSFRWMRNFPVARGYPKWDLLAPSMS